MNLYPDKPLAFVACYYNPCGFEKRRNNYAKFVEKLGDKAELLVTVELAFDNQSFSFEHLPNSIQLRTKSLMWQKEALLNIGIKEVTSAGYEYVSWLDADIAFKNEDWYDRILKALDEYQLVHVFENIKRYDDNDKFQLMKGTIASIGRNSPATGFGWACRSVLFNGDFGLYDRCIVGGGDTLIYAAAAEEMLTWLTKRPPTVKHGLHIVDWANKWYALTAGDIGYAENNIDTFFHGNLKQRNYLNRHEILLRSNYSPTNDLINRDDGILEWTDSVKTNFKSSIRDYFASREEDG